MFLGRRPTTSSHISDLWDSTSWLSSTVPFLSYHFHMPNTWVNRTAGGSLAWHNSLHLSLPLDPGNQEGISKERGLASSYSHKSPNSKE